ncbi:Transient-receptor-potential-like protein, partial [Trichinella pseudospiralis]
LKENLRRLPTALILCCQTEEEAAVMLKESQGAPVGSLTAFPRVSVAIDTDQKDFLNDPRCLTVLKKKFKGEWADWNGLSNSEKVARIAVHTVGYPITSLVNVLTNGKVFKSYSTPVARYDLILMSIYLLAFNAFMNSWLEVKHHGQPYAHRVHWDPYHPTLLFEVLFTFASVMASWRLFYFFQIFRAYGPIVVSWNVYLNSIFVVVVGSFALGLNYLMEHYKGNVVLRDGKLFEQPAYMTSIESAVRYLYWAWYGYLDPERLEVVVGQFGPDKEEIKHYLVQYAAEFLSASYYVILVVSLLNLMISIMSSTAGAVLNLMVELKHRLLGRRALEENFGKEAIIITEMETLNIYNAI